MDEISQIIQSYKTCLNCQDVVVYAESNEVYEKLFSTQADSNFNFSEWLKNGLDFDVYQAYLEDVTKPQHNQNIKSLKLNFGSDEQHRFYLLFILNFPLLNPRRNLQVFSSIFEITQTKLLELSRKKMGKKYLNPEEVFLANISHEIRTPMNGILGMVNCLKETELSKEQKEMIRVISNCGDGLLTILNDILDYTKIKSGNLELEHISFNLKEILFDVLSLFVAKAKEKNNLIKLDISKNLPIFYRGDPNRIKQIVANLLSNAIKFTSQAKITLKADYVRRNGEWLVKVSIIDNGIGISVENQEEIFKSFKQEDSSTSRRFGGTGLGLSICSQLSQALKGSLAVDSEVGKGSTFTVCLPLVLDEEVSQVKPILSEENKINSVNRDNFPHDILVVEDNLINQKIACSLLGKLGYQVDKACNGKEAIDLAKKKKYSLIFMDMQMPEVDGLEATREILKNQTKNRPKIIAMTANIFEEDKKNCYEAGMTGFINKPFKLIDIKKAILAA